MKYFIFSVFIIILLFPVNSFAEVGQRLTVDGYSCHISAIRLSSKLLVNGKVKGGESTDLLRLRIYIVDENGKSISVNASIKRYRKYGRFSVKIPQESGGNRWTVTEVYISN